LAHQLVGGGERRVGGLPVAGDAVVDDQRADRASFVAPDQFAPAGRVALVVVAVVDGDDVAGDRRDAGRRELGAEGVEAGRMDRRLGLARVAVRLEHGVAAADEVHVAAHHAALGDAAHLGGERVVRSELGEGDGDGQQLLVARRDVRPVGVHALHRHPVHGDGDTPDRRHLIDDRLQVVAEGVHGQIALGQCGHSPYRQERHVRGHGCGGRRIGRRRRGRGAVVQPPPDREQQERDRRGRHADEDERVDGGSRPVVRGRVHARSRRARWRA
jgi:hypothetical protein